MRRELLEPNRVPHALLTGDLTADGEVHGWGVNRSRPFTDDDLDVLRAFEGFLRRAAADRRRHHLVLDLEHSVASGAGLLLAHGEHVTYLNDEAAALLEKHRVPATTVVALSRTVLTSANPVAGLPTRHGALRLRWRPALPGASAVVVDEPRAAAAVAAALTNRQYAILCHLSNGLTAAAIGRYLGISERTVHKHLQHLYRTLSVTDRLAAVSRGRGLGLLPVVGGCGQLEGTTHVGG
nr:LuxR C-terminal-related transcriptional regulator [Kineococcus aurantiacus]